MLDPGLLRIVDVTSGLKDNGILVINTKKKPEQIREEFGIDYSLAIVDATSIARQILGVPITNTSMVGAVVKVTGEGRIQA
ncbi:unnamed protein product [marine sediment metagenome]|uniref:Pyruvate/ketoisovalerate oxidoreductase catalytic domain-containing protein n=1 Tax=marine sediment metagenome TaxID=412755 RepID=X1LU16_9ZZZZ